MFGSRPPNEDTPHALGLENSPNTNAVNSYGIVR